MKKKIELIKVFLFDIFKFIFRRKKVSFNAIRVRKFNPITTNLHIKEFMLGQTPRFIFKDQNVLDIGSSTGGYAAYWSKFCKNVYCFEPSTIVFGELKKQKKKCPNIILNNFALSNFEGKTKFYLDKNRLSENSLIPNNKKIEETVEVKKLDQLNLSEVCFIKIDTEGTEMDVINGGINLIKKYNPTVMCEIYFKNTSPSKAREIFNFFYNLNYYSYYKLRDKDGLTKIKNLDEAITLASDEKLQEKIDSDFLFTVQDV